MKFLKSFVLQAYGVENIKFVASKIKSSNIVPKMILFRKIEKYI